MVNLIDVDIELFRKRIKHKLIILYGAGRAAQNCFEIYDIEKKILAICDGDKSMIGKKYNFHDSTYPIYDVSDIKKIIENKEIAILISSTIYAFEIVELLDKIVEFDGVDCYCHVLLRNHITEQKPIVLSCGPEIIPKKIHYCWFGGHPIPDHLKRYMDTWSQTNPDFEIIRHDETNYDYSKNQYMWEAYKEKAWGFVPDYARLDIIYNEGGIYLDTDVELLQSIKPLLRDETFFGFGDNTVINLGNGFGSIKGSEIIKSMRDYYDNYSFINIDGSHNRTPCPLFQAPIFKKFGFNPHLNSFQKSKGVVVYPNYILNPMGTAAVSLKTIDNALSFAIHHDDRSWFTKEELDCVNKMNVFFNKRLGNNRND